MLLYNRIKKRRKAMRVVKRIGLFMVVSLLMLGGALLVPVQADTIYTITAQTPPVIGGFSLSFSDTNNDGVYTPSAGDQFVTGSLVWFGGWKGNNGILTDLIHAPLQSSCDYTNDTGNNTGGSWVFWGINSGGYQYYDSTNLHLSYTETSSALPCPTAALLLGSGLLGLAAARRQKLRRP